MKVAVAILVCAVIQQACGFSFPSFETNGALERIKEAGREIIAKASKNVEELQETVQEKKKSLIVPTEKVTEMWKQVEEEFNNKKEEWKQRKQQMKEMYKDLKKKAGENKDELIKMWKENKGTWRQQAEEKWQEFKSMTAEQLEQFKQEIDGLEERLDATAPEKPWKKIKEIRSGVKSLLIAMKEAFKVKLREMKEEEELGPGTEEEVANEETFTDGPFTDGPFTDEPAPTITITTIPEETLNATEVITDQFEPTEMLSTPATEVLPTEYPDEDLDGDEDWSEEVVNDEQQTGEESEEDSQEEGDDEDDVLPEEPMGGGVEEEDEDEDEGPVSEEHQGQEKPSRVNILSRLMSERRKQKMKQWLKRGKAMKTEFKKGWKNWFKRHRGDEN